MAQVVGPSEVTVGAEVDAEVEDVVVEDVVVDVGDAEAKQCKIWLEWVGARN